MGLLTADDVVSALAVSCGEEPDGPAEAVALVRQAQPSLAATLYSVWQAEGAELHPGLSYDLEMARARNERYRAVAADLGERMPGLIPIKGLDVAARYPDGVVRAMNDLDYVAPAEPELWRACKILVEDGWELHTATFARFDNALQVVVSLRQPHENAYVLPYGVEIANHFTLGDLGGVPPLFRLPEPWEVPLVRNVLMLLFERFEQPFRARDLVDFSMLLGSATPAELAAVRAAIERLGLEPEYAELTHLVSATSLPPLPPMATGQARATRVRRAARRVGFFRRPVLGAARHLQRRMINGRSRSYERWPWAAAQRRFTAATALRGGLVTFGLPLPDTASPGERAVLRERAELCWVDTPVGRFLLTIGDDVEESAVEQLAARSPDGAVTEPVA